MSAPHFVRDFQFDIAFARETDAFERHNELSSFVSDRLMSVADEVFTRLSPGANEIVKIEILDIDIGSIPASTYFTDAEQRFREKLEEALRDKVDRLRVTTVAQVSPGSAHEAIDHDGIFGEARKEFETIAVFLERGYLPWNIHSLTGRELTEMLRRVLARQGPELAARLSSATDKSAIARRISAQFAPDLRDSIVALLRGPGTLPVNLDPVAELLDALKSGQTETEDILLERALVTGNPDPLLSWWGTLLRERPERIAYVVRRQGVRTEVRRAVARGFPDEMLSDIARVLEPGEIGFIEEIVSRPEIFREAAKKRSESWPETKAHLWEFTLAYLLIESGSRFNRLAYISSVVRRMAAHYNAGYADLLVSLTESLNRFELPSAVREQMMTLLSELQEREASRPAATEEDEGEKWDLLFEAAIRTGDAAPIDEIWQEMLRVRRQSIEIIVRRHGRKAEIRRAMAQRLPLPMLRDIAEVLEPSEIGFIEEVAKRPELFFEAAKQAEPHVEPAAVLQRLLWELTFTYLLAERGSRFNRRSYMRSLIRQTAAGDSRDLHDALLLLEQVLDAIDLPSPLRTELLSVISELHGDNASAQPVEPDDEVQWLERLESALISGKTGPVAGWWESRIFVYRNAVVATIRRLGRAAEVRLAIAQGFPLPMLRDVAEILEPSEVAFIEELTGQPEVFDRAASTQATSAPPLRRRLWEFTLTYLLVERGSAFNKRSYAASVIRQMAAHRNVRYEDLLHSLAAAVGEARGSGQLKREMSALLAALGGGPKPAEPREPQTDDSQPAAQTPGMPDVIRSFEIYDLIVTLLSAGEDPASERVSGLILLLRRDYPWQYARLLDETDALKGRAGLSAHATTEIPDSEIEQLVMRAARLSQSEKTALIRALDRLLTEPRERFLALIRELPDRPEVLSALIEFLPDRQLARIMLLVAPSGWHCIFTTREPESANRLRWRFLFERFIHRTSRVAEHEIIREFTAWLAAEPQQAVPAVLSKAPPDRARAVAEKPRHKPTHLESARKEIYIRNAGQVLAAPYFPRLFQMADLLEENKFRDARAAERATHLLQYMVEGTERPPEHVLPLNKILCGLEPETPVARDVELARSEKDTVDSLLKAMIAHWSILGHTSIQGLRETFLQREGRLRLAPNGWQLLVQPRAFDMLLDRLPWGFKTIKHPWMLTTVFVEWR